MIPSKPPLFVKITPVVENGLTEVDLGGEMSDFVPARHSSLPPSPTRVEYDHKPREARQGSLPPPGKLPKIRFPSPVEGSIKEIDEEMDNSDDSEPESESDFESESKSESAEKVS
jgi:hypothetical protein